MKNLAFNFAVLCFFEDFEFRTRNWAEKRKVNLFYWPLFLNIGKNLKECLFFSKTLETCNLKFFGENHIKTVEIENVILPNSIPRSKYTKILFNLL